MAAKVTKLNATSKPKTTAARSAKPAAAAMPEPRLELRMKDLVERVMDRGGIKKGEARSAVEMTLAVLGEAIDKGEEVNVPAFGKLKIQRQKDTDKGRVHVLRLVRKDRHAAPATEAD